MNEFLDNLLNTRDLDLYLNSLKLLSKNYLVLLFANSKIVNYMTQENIDKIHNLMFSKIKTNSSYVYIGVNDRGHIIKDDVADLSDKYTFFEENLNDTNVKIVIQNNITLAIGNEEYFFEPNVISFIVYDYTSKHIIDFSDITVMFSKTLFFHRNLNFNTNFFDTHFYFPKQYKDIMCRPFRYSYFSNRAPNVIRIENGIIEPIKNVNGIDCGGVCDDKFNFISGHLKILSGHKKGYDCYSSYRVESEELDYIDEEVVFGGLMINHPGHLILESLGERLWWLIENSNLKYRVAIITLWDNGFARFFREFMEVLGLPKERWFVVNKPTKFRKIIIPDSAVIMSYGYEPYEFTKKYVSFFEYLKGKVTPFKYKKVYLTKSKTKYRNIIGEEFFIDFFRKKGFEIINPEDYTIKQKAEIMMGAEEVVTLSGTNALFPIFCNPSVKITILSKMDSVNAALGGYAMIYNAFGYKNINVVNVCMSFLHKEFTFGLALIGATDDFRDYIMYNYGENLNITFQESLQQNIYNYLKFFPEHYTSVKMFEQIKNQKMLNVLQMMSEVFLGKAFDTTKLNLTTNEDNLKNQVNKLTADLTASQKRIKDLENSDIYKAAKLLETVNAKFENQLVELKKSEQIIVQLKQEAVELTNKNSELEKDVYVTKELNKQQSAEIKNLFISLNESQAKEVNSINKISELEKSLMQEINLKKKGDEEIQNLSVELNDAKNKLQNITKEIKKLEEENARIKYSLTQLQSSRSWRYTRIFRKNKEDYQI